MPEFKELVSGEYFTEIVDTKLKARQEAKEEIVIRQQSPTSASSTELTPRQQRAPPTDRTSFNKLTGKLAIKCTPRRGTSE